MVNRRNKGIETRTNGTSGHKQPGGLETSEGASPTLAGVEPVGESPSIPRISPFDISLRDAGDTTDADTGDTGDYSSSESERIVTPGKRGRKPGSKNRTHPESALALSQSLAGIEGAIFGIYNGIAAILHAPEWELEKEEAKRYAESLKRLSEQYPNMIVSAKTIAWIEFTSAMAAIHIPRVLKTAERLKQKTAVKFPPVVPIRAERPVTVFPDLSVPVFPDLYGANGGE